MLKRKWSAIILRHLADGISEPAVICTREPELSRVALNERLRTMLRYQLIARLTGDDSESTRYQLTARGDKLLKMLTVIEQLDQLQDVVIQVLAPEQILLSARTTQSLPAKSIPASKWRSRKKTVS